MYYLRKSVFLIFLNNHLTDYYTMTYCLKRKNKNVFFLFKVCLTSILQNSNRLIKTVNLTGAIMTTKYYPFVTVLYFFCYFFDTLKNGNSKSKRICKPEGISLISLRVCAGEYYELLRLFARLRCRVVETGQLQPGCRFFGLLYLCLQALHHRARLQSCRA